MPKPKTSLPQLPSAAAGDNYSKEEFDSDACFDDDIVGGEINETDGSKCEDGEIMSAFMMKCLPWML